MNYEDLDKETLIKVIMQKDDMLNRLRLEKEKLNYYANIDTMTGVFNRRAGMELLSREFELSKANNRNIVICFADMDRLKMINDMFGHEEGDKALVNVAEILKDSIKKTDFVIRMGGDEFLIVSPETTMKEVNEIKEFVEDECGSNNELLGEEVVGDWEKEGYILKGAYEKNLSEKEVLAISKVLLESRGFIKSEVKDILYKLLDNCISDHKEKIEFIIGNELVNYVSPQHGKELLSILWEISSAIKDKKMLEIEYSRVGREGKIQNETSKRILKPQGLLFSEYYFYLIAYIDGRSDKYPTIYRVDRIKNLIVKNQKYKKDYNDRFKDGEFRKLIS